MPYNKDGKRDSFYKRGGTYNSIFTEKNANIDSKIKDDKDNFYKNFIQVNSAHTKIALISGKETYNNRNSQEGHA